MFDLPDSTRVDRFIPKTKFYERTTIATAARDEFTQNIGRITWLYKLAESTLHTPPSDSVREIQIFEIELKQKIIPQKALTVIDKVIPYPILFVLKYGEDTCYLIQHKLDKKRRYYKTRWNSAPQFNFSGINLGAIYNRLVLSSILIEATNSQDEYLSFEEQVSKNDLREQLKKDVTALENKIQKERQFSKKVALNTDLQKKRRELEASL